MTNDLRVGFIGLGDMGGAMVPRIMAASFPVALWARRDASLEQYESSTYTRAESPADLAAKSDVVGLCVFDENDVREMLTGSNGVLSTMAPGGIVLVHATISVEASQEFEQAGKTVGVSVLDAPVSGSREGAVNGTLAVMVGGSPDAYARAEPVMQTYGGCVRLLGPVGSGQKMKVLNNVLVAVNLRSAYQALTTAHDLGLDSGAVQEVLQAASGNSPALRSLVNKLLVDPPRARHSLRMIEKDVRLFQKVCASAGLERTLLDELAEETMEVVAQLGIREESGVHA